MKLKYKQAGSGTPLVILHGLFGTLENWGAQVKSLSRHYQVIALDLRNHGRSPWADPMDYPAMVADVVETLDTLGVERFLLLGHSMGGKAAMQLALNHPERVEKLIVVDIAPVVYTPNHDSVFKGLFSVDLQALKSRGEAERQLAEQIEEPSVRQFLLKNLYRDGERFAWRMNLEVLHRDYDRLSEAPEGPAPFEGPTLFIKGANSGYILPEHREAILERFPSAQSKVIEGAGHWPHAEKPAAFLRVVEGFLGAPSP